MPIGALRKRAAKILSKGFDYTIEPHQIEPVAGVWKSAGVYRWELYTHSKRGIPQTFGCWETLREFVRLASKNGFDIDLQIQEISAKEE